MKGAIVLLGVFCVFLLARGASLPKPNVEGKTAGTGILVVGGEDAIPNEFPWLVNLEIRNGIIVGLCGGALIKLDVILTAAHCLDDYPRNRNIKVTAGDHRFRIPDGTEQVTIGVESYKLHENYTKWNGNRHDIAVIKLGTSFKETATVRAIGLVDSDFDAGLSKNATVAGWGTLRFQGTTPVTLQKAVVPIVTDITCNRTMTNPEGQFCAGNSMVDSCQGDSGGPLLCSENPGAVCGIVSYGNGCATPGWPGVYTKVAFYKDWIIENAGTL